MMIQALNSKTSEVSTKLTDERYAYSLKLIVIAYVAQ